MATDSGLSASSDVSTSDALSELREIRMRLEKMDKRDRLRTVGGFFRSIINIIPVILLLWSSWYFYKHGPEIINMISLQAATSAASLAKDHPEMFIPKDTINNMMNDPRIQGLIKSSQSSANSSSSVAQ